MSVDMLIFLWVEKSGFLRNEQLILMIFGVSIALVVDNQQFYTVSWVLVFEFCLFWGGIVSWGRKQYFQKVSRSNRGAREGQRIAQEFEFFTMALVGESHGDSTTSQARQRLLPGAGAGRFNNMPDSDCFRGGCRAIQQHVKPDSDCFRGESHGDSITSQAR